MNDIRVYDKSDLRKYRTEIPNTVVKGELSKKLSVYSKFLYLYLKSVAGDNGECWQSTKTLAEGTGMAAGTVSKCKKELAKRGLIKIKKGDPKKGQSDTITITDIWGKNMIEYATDQTPSCGEHPPSSDERTPSCGEHPPSSDEPKKEPYNQERTLEEESAREGVAPPEDQDSKEQPDSRTSPGCEDRMYGVPVPEPLRRVEGFCGAYRKWWDYNKTAHRRHPNIHSVEQQFQKLLALAKDGHRPTEVIAQSIEHMSKSFYPIRDDFDDGSQNDLLDTNPLRHARS